MAQSVQAKGVGASAPEDVEVTAEAGVLRQARRYASIATFVAVWEAAAVANSSMANPPINPFLLPAPHKLLSTAVELAQSGVLLSDVVASLERVIAGFLIVAVLGVALGLVSGHFKPVEEIVNPLVEIFRPIPPLAFLPMFIVYLGIGEVSKIAFIAFGAFFPIYVNTFQGVRYTQPLLLRSARSLGANRWQLIFRVVLPSAMPDIITGLRLGFGMALFVLVAAELIAAQVGIGYRIMDARQLFRVDVMLVGAFTIGVLGFLSSIGFRRLEDYLLRWKDKEG